MKKLLVPALLVLGSVAFFVLAVETYFRLFPDRIPRSIEHLARAGVYAFEPDVGVVLRPGIDVRVTVPRLDREIRVRTADHGLDIGFRDDGLQGGRRIAILGDSYVFGYAVDQDESFPAQLEAILRGAGREVDVVNAGVPGFSPRLERQLLEKYLSQLDPDLVLVAVYENDFEDSLYYETRRFSRPRTFLGVNSRLYQLLSAARAHLNRTAKPGRHGGDRAGRPPRTHSGEGARIVLEEIRRMAGICRDQGMGFAVILLPGDPPIPVSRVAPEGAGYPVLDLGPRFEGLHRREYQNDFVGHLTPSANRLVAEEIRGFIEREGLLPPSPSKRAEAAGGSD